MVTPSKIAIWQWLPFLKWRVVALVESADEIPDRLPRNGAVIVGSHSFTKWIVFDCPCRRGHRIMISTDKTHFPHWNLMTKNKLTISPSIDYVNQGVRCHYFIRGGDVKWI